MDRRGILRAIGRGAVGAGVAAVGVKAAEAQMYVVHQESVWIDGLAALHGEDVGIILDTTTPVTDFAQTLMDEASLSSAKSTLGLRGLS